MDSVTDRLTLHFDLVEGAGWAGQQVELLRLKHGVVSAGHHHAVTRPPATGLVSQLQDAGVGQHVDGDGRLWANCGKKKEM